MSRADRKIRYSPILISSEINRSYWDVILVLNFDYIGVLLSNYVPINNLRKRTRISCASSQQLSPAGL
jgi:hypothetical protein